MAADDQLDPAPLVGADLVMALGFVPTDGSPGTDADDVTLHRVGHPADDDGMPSELPTTPDADAGPSLEALDEESGSRSEPELSRLVDDAALDETGVDDTVEPVEVDDAEPSPEPEATVEVAAPDDSDDTDESALEADPTVDEEPVDDVPSDETPTDEVEFEQSDPEVEDEPEPPTDASNEAITEPAAEAEIDPDPIENAPVDELDNGSDPVGLGGADEADDEAPAETEAVESVAEEDDMRDDEDETSALFAVDDEPGAGDGPQPDERVSANGLGPDVDDEHPLTDEDLVASGLFALDEEPGPTPDPTEDGLETGALETGETTVADETIETTIETPADEVDEEAMTVTNSDSVVFDAPPRVDRPAEDDWLGTPDEIDLRESEPTVTTAAVAAPVVAERAGRGGTKLRSRKVRRLVRHIDPWSVLVVSVLLHLIVFAAFLLAGTMVWNVAEQAGTIDNVENFVEDLGDYERFEIDGDAIFRAAVMLAGVLTLASTILVVLLTVVFNLLSDLVGGIRVTVVEEETVRLPGE